jgi:hypothetical protein
MRYDGQLFYGIKIGSGGSLMIGSVNAQASRPTPSSGALSPKFSRDLFEEFLAPVPRYVCPKGAHRDGADADVSA